MLHQLLSQGDWPPAKLLRTDERGLQRCSQRWPERDAPALGVGWGARRYGEGEVRRRCLEKTHARILTLFPSASLSPHPTSSRCKEEKSCRRVGQSDDGRMGRLSLKSTLRPKDGDKQGTEEPSFKVLDGNSPVIPGTDRPLEASKTGM
uniref:Uncharacterized protein n=1 Tax=Micrurus carvalhoi TaxID=3147026 RepID=A0A2H6N6H3_9SAUR